METDHNLEDERVSVIDEDFSELADGRGGDTQDAEADAMAETSACQQDLAAIATTTDTLSTMISIPVSTECASPAQELQAVATTSGMEAMDDSGGETSKKFPIGDENVNPAEVAAREGEPTSAEQTGLKRTRRNAAVKAIALVSPNTIAAATEKKKRGRRAKVKEANEEREERPQSSLADTQCAQPVAFGEKRKEDGPVDDFKPVKEETTSAGEDKKEPRVRWSHQLRHDDDDKQCFICRTRTGDLLQCGFGKGASACPIKFHSECIAKYDAGGYHKKFLDKQFGASVCPRHYCDPCFVERRKTTATHRDGLAELIECDTCYRSFHVACRPAGLDHEAKKDVPAIPGKRIAVTCHSHWRTLGHGVCLKRYNALKEIPHTGFCCECERKDEEEDGRKIDSRMLNCSNCPRSFHEKCHLPCVVLGEQWEGKDTKLLCEPCIIGDTPRVGQHHVVWYTASGKGWFPCTAVDQVDFPDSKAAQREKFYDGIGYPGFVPVKWLGYKTSTGDACFGMMPLAHLVPMTPTAWMMMINKALNPCIEKAWEEAQNDLDVPRPFFKHDGVVVKPIKTSAYHPACAPLSTSRPVDPESFFACDCSPVDGKRHARCESDCMNKASGQECPPCCNDEAGGIACGNRRVSQQLIYSGVETRETKMKGRGVFAKRHIPKGTFIGEYAGEIISQAECDKRNRDTSAWLNDEETHYMMKLSSCYVDAKYMGNITRYINHSCQPNCLVSTVTVFVPRKRIKGAAKGEKCGSYEDRVFITTIAPIEKDEELAFDYDMVQQSKNVKLPPCHCGAKKCRGTLGRTAEERKMKKDMRDMSPTPSPVKITPVKKTKAKAGGKRGANKEVPVGLRHETPARGGKRMKAEPVEEEQALMDAAPVLQAEVSPRDRRALSRARASKEGEEMEHVLVAAPPSATVGDEVKEVSVPVRKRGRPPKALKLPADFQQQTPIDHDAMPVLHSAVAVPSNKENEPPVAVKKEGVDEKVEEEREGERRGKRRTSARLHKAPLAWLVHADCSPDASPSRGLRRRCKKPTVYTP